MHSMKQEDTLVVGGVDAHADSHHAAVLDRRGALLGTESFPTTTPGYRRLLDWLCAFGEVDVVAVESTGSYAAALVRYLRERGVGSSRSTSRTRIRAAGAARATRSMPRWPPGSRWRERATTVPKQTDGIVESIRLLRAARQSAVKSRSAAMVQLGGLIVTAPQELRDQLSCRKTIRGKAALCRRLRLSTGELRRPTHAAKFALRSIAGRIDALDAEIAVLDRQLKQLVGAAAPRTTRLLGISTGHAGRLLLTAGQNIDRLRGEAAFAALCGASPVPASSGKTSRHRLNHGGERQANRALHLIAVCRLRYCARTRAYARRRTGEGKTKPEIMRCLKRYIAREVYYALRGDLASLDHPRQATSTIICGAGPIGIAGRRT
jgi:transposase